MAELLSTKIKNSLEIYKEDNTNLIIANSNALTCNVPLKVNKNYTGDDYELIKDDSGIFKRYNPDNNIYTNNEYYYTIRALTKNSYNKDTFKKIDINQMSSLNFSKVFTLTTISIPKDKIEENSSVFGSSLDFEISTKDLLDACEKKTSLNFDVCSVVNIVVKYRQSITIRSNSSISSESAQINSMTKKYHSLLYSEEESYYIINILINTPSLRSIKDSILQYGAEITGSFEITFTFTNKHPVYNLKNNPDLKNLKEYYSVSHVNSISSLNSLTNITSDLFINNNMFLKANSSSLYIDNLILYEDKIFSKIKKYSFSVSSTDGESFTLDSSAAPIFDFDGSPSNHNFKYIFNDFGSDYLSKDIYLLSSDLMPEQPREERLILQNGEIDSSRSYYTKELNITGIVNALKVQTNGTIHIIFYAVVLKEPYNYERIYN